MSEHVDREGYLRIRGPLYEKWLRRCHREGIDPDQAARIHLSRALEKEGSLIGAEDIGGANAEED